MTHGTEPDWEALAEEHAARLRRGRRLRWAGGMVLAACALGGIVGTALVRDADGGPGPLSGGSPSSASADGRTGPPRLLPDHNGRADLALGPDARVEPVPGGHALRLRSGPGSYAQSADRVVNPGTSFTVSVWVYDVAGAGTRSAISEGDGAASSFDLGRDDSNGRPAWVFRVQGADGGTAVQALAPADGPTTGRWVLLTGVHDAGRHSITLYVDGAQAATVPATVRSGPGPLQLGRARRQGDWTDSWAGAVACVQVFDEALDPGRIGALKNGGTLDTGTTGAWLVD